MEWDPVLDMDIPDEYTPKEAKSITGSAQQWQQPPANGDPDGPQDTPNANAQALTALERERADAIKLWHQARANATKRNRAKQYAGGQKVEVRTYTGEPKGFWRKLFDIRPYTISTRVVWELPDRRCTDLYLDANGNLVQKKKDTGLYVLSQIMGDSKPETFRRFATIVDKMFR